MFPYAFASESYFFAVPVRRQMTIISYSNGNIAEEEVISL